MARINTLLLFLAITAILPEHIFGQSNRDTLYFKNANRIIGEMKSLDRGILTVETDYSDNDFAIEWTKVSSIKGGTRFLITLKDGLRFNGSMESVGDSGKVLLKGRRSPSADGETIESRLADIVYLKGLSSKFWSRASANIDFGISLTKANNLRQYNGRTKVGYLADKWQMDITYDALRSKQDSIEATNRQEISAGFNYFLPADWLLGAGINFLTNTEQALALRTSAKLGAGKFIIHTNKLYWKALTGLSFNKEKFSNNTDQRTSLEGFFGYELNIFDLGDLNLFNTVYVYPSFTESGRWRSDIKLDLKYDLPKDFYIRFGATMNYDNQPAIAGKETDYVFNFSVGWEL